MHSQPAHVGQAFVIRESTSFRRELASCRLGRHQASAVMCCPQAHSISDDYERNMKLQLFNDYLLVSHRTMLTTQLRRGIDSRKWCGFSNFIRNVGNIVLRFHSIWSHAGSETNLKSYPTSVWFVHPPGADFSSCRKWNSRWEVSLCAMIWNWPHRLKGKSRDRNPKTQNIVHRMKRNRITKHYSSGWQTEVHGTAERPTGEPWNHKSLRLLHVVSRAQREWSCFCDFTLHERRSLRLTALQLEVFFPSSCSSPLHIWNTNLCSTPPENIDRQESTVETSHLHLHILRIIYYRFISSCFMIHLLSVFHMTYPLR